MVSKLDKLTRESKLIFKTVFVLILALLLTWIVQAKLEIQGDAIVITLLLIPLAVYLALSGRVAEITAGDVSIRLREARNERVSETIAQDESSLIYLTGLIVKTNPNIPHVLAITQQATSGEGHSDTFPAPTANRESLLRAINDWADSVPVPLILILDKHQRVLAYLTYNSALDVLQRKSRGDEFIELINSDNPDLFDDGAGFSAIKTETLSGGATNAEALETMESANMDTLVVVDRKGKYVGIVERGGILSRMMLALVSTEHT
jgi:hypothetical protein